LVTGVKDGTAIIAYTAANKKATYSITVTTDSFMIAGNRQNLIVNGDTTFTGTPANGVWRSSKPEIVRVDKNGNIKF